MKKSLTFLCVFAVALVMVWQALGPKPSPAQGTFPTRPIELLCPWSPTGGAGTFSTLVARIINQDKLSPVTITTNFKPGANGLIGAALMKDKKGDPYVFMNGGGALVPQTVLGKTPVNPLKELVPLALNIQDSSVIITRADSPFKTLADVVAQLKKKPKSVTMAGSGGGADSWDGMLEILIGASTGVEFNQIPMVSGGDVQSAILGKHVDLGTRQLSNAATLLKSGDMKALVIFDAVRHPDLPNVPTMRELGFDVVLNMARAWFGAQGINKEVVQWYAELFEKLHNHPQFIDFCKKKGVRRVYMGPADFAKQLEKDMNTVETYYKRVGIIK